jgi:transketolase
MYLKIRRLRNTMEQRVVEVAYDNKIGHVGSCLTTVPILDHIYKHKGKDDIVILSAGHAGIALYAALEKYEGKDADALYKKHGVHPNRDIDNGIHVSTGSLGSGITIAVGYALADKKRNVHVIISDGECAEGSVWESLAYIRNAGLKNCKVHVNVNGYSAYDKVNMWYLWLRLKAFNWRTKIWFTKNPDFDFLKGLQAHYHVLSKEHKEVMISSYNNAQRVC